MSFHRPIGVCPCCSQVVEWYSDGIGGPHPYRCGNCFQGMDGKQLKRLEAMSAALQDLDEQRATLLRGAVLNVEG
jgi:hypothetical protein